MKVIKSKVCTVVDGVFSDSQLEVMDNYFASYPFWGLGYDMQEYGAKSATLCKSLKYEQWVGFHGIIQDINDIMTKRLAELDIKTPLFPRALMNNFKFGDSPMYHKDSPNNPDGLTYMVYPNKCWDYNWGGETKFADKDHNVIDCVNPKPGRIVIFPGEVDHAGIAPTKIHEGYGRFSIAYQDPLGFPKSEERKTVKPEDIETTSMVSLYGNDYKRLS